MNYFFNSETGTLNPLHGWLGQVVDDSTWAYNHANSDFKHKLHTTQDIAGASYRCKVRIIGKSSDVKDIPDEQLPMAEMLLPVTAGSGHGGSEQTPNIRQGCYVFGFYKDGINATEPVIVGVLPNDPRVPLFGGDPAQPFVQRSGFIGKRASLPVSTLNIKLDGPNPTITAEGVHPNQAKLSHQDQNLDGKRSFYIPKTINCEGASGEVKGIQKVLKQLLIDVKRIKRFAQQAVGAASNILSNITSLINTATALISGFVTSMISKVRGFVVNLLNRQIAKLFDLLPPNLRPNAAQGSEIANNILQCVFEKIISKLFAIAQQLLFQVVDRYVNAPMCAAESFVASLISSILGELTSGIFSALGQIVGAASSVLGLLFQAFDIIIGILEFLTCKPDLDCEVLDEWNFWDGSNIAPSELFSSSGFGKKLQSFINSGTAFGGGLIPGCSSTQIPCGPPGVAFFGGSPVAGLGAAGNVVVGLSGQIMGVDLVTGGRYTGTPSVNIVDSCGLGGGSVAYPVQVRVETSNQNQFDKNKPVDSVNNLPETPIYTIDNIVIIDPGAGYIQLPNGSTGGDGVIFSYPDETIVDVDVYAPGVLVGVTTGQNIYMPNNTFSEILNEQNEVVQILYGKGHLSPIISNVTGTFLTPTETSVASIGNTSISFTSDDISFTINSGIGTTFSVRGQGSITLPSLGTVKGEIVATYNNSNNISVRSTGVINLFSSGVGDGTISITGIGTISEALDQINTTNGTISGRGTININLLNPTPETNFELDNAAILGLDTAVGIGTTQILEVSNNDESTYLVVSVLEDLAILSEGVNYSSTDKIEITPSNGAEFTPIFDKFGSLKDVELVSKGYGFVDNPKISILSETGINVNIVPVFKFIKVRTINDLDSVLGIGLNTPVIKVVDCVGKV